MQHRLKEHGKEVNELLLQKAYFYVCGDAANMAREVNSTLAQIIAEHRGLPESKGEEIVKAMRSVNQYQVRHFSQSASVLCVSLRFNSPAATSYRVSAHTSGLLGAPVQAAAFS